MESKKENIFYINNLRMQVTSEVFKLASGLYKELLIEIYEDGGMLGGYFLKSFRYKENLKTYSQKQEKNIYKKAYKYIINK